MRAWNTIVASGLRPLAIGETAVFLPRAGRFPEIEQLDR